MAAKPYTKPSWKEIRFKDEGLDARALITRTDTKGIITFASLAYRKMTKFDKNDLIGSPHSIVRHPFMPEAGFKDMWDTIQRGEHWKGMVMNLRKDSNHYWVEVHCDPIDKEGGITSDTGKIAGYLAIRREPTREEVQQAYEVYREVRKEELLRKKALKEWEKELLEILDKLPQKADNLLAFK